MQSNQAPGNAQATADQTLAAMHWDINAFAQFYKITQDRPTAQEKKQYNQMCEPIQDFINKAVLDNLLFATRALKTSRCISFIQMEGWMMYTICSFSESFRRALMEYNDTMWSALENLISQNARSIDVFARARELPWKAPLQANEKCGLPYLLAALGSDINIATEHPHHTVQTASGSLRRPENAGCAQINISSNILHPSCPKPDPSMRQPGWPPCDLCGAVEGGCGCRINAMIGDLVELVEYGMKGIGVRALCNIKKGDIIGEFTGEILPSHAPDYSNYALMGALGREELRHIYYVDPVFLGNWTRYINHSCEASTYFSPVVAGDRVVMVAIAERDIGFHEELTIDYGPGYWSGSRVCYCGSKNCYSPLVPTRRLWNPPQ
ncbi:hypothetical protein N7495_003311 [Penicillium taxi]|uniref:uncharacterized protein n=1 Tax=Penicillium taxi TaxID=168475 RepID=UPI00254545B1|nr:uncharacterized protein N7495_003311 [Penicillium taxi]KAJ5902783.1 hypothetical protein N7495_003311 [Penicillium taxi]